MLRSRSARPKASRWRAHLCIALLALAALSLSGAPGALADGGFSKNWAGYAVHRSGVRFRQVRAAWRVPSASCTRGHRTYSAVWVGLGGFNRGSRALEQIGTEVDCRLSGRLGYFAWYEIVPAPSRRLGLRVRPGDVMAASVTVVGHRTTLKLADLTRQRSVTKRLQTRAVDVSSAEWIVEAPSACISATVCQTLPLANFTSTTFAFAGARAVTGSVGTIASPAWGTTVIALVPAVGHHLRAGGAAPSALTGDGSSFSVSYVTVSTRTDTPSGAPHPRLGPGYLVHPAR